MLTKYTESLDDVVRRWYANNCQEDITWYIVHRGEDFQKAITDYLKKPKTKSYIYMVTFTVSPKCKMSEDKIEKYIESQATRTALKIDRFEYVKEYTKKGVAHWHALVVTQKPLKHDRFNYYETKIGRVDIAPNKAQQTSEILNYITKIGDTKILK